MPPASAPSFPSLLYRYWFFGWLFRDASRGNALERDAALRHNLERARWLPTYMRRWAVLGLLMYASGGALEWLGLEAVAPLAFVPVCVAAPVLAVAGATWWMLRGPRSAYVRPPRR
jgi:hypothetical protein